MISGETENSERNLPECHVVHHETDLKSAEIESGSPR
jgi:hypothetical protein